MELDDFVSAIPGVGDKTAALYRKLHIQTIEDLLEHYPTRYLRYEEPVDIHKVPFGQRVAIRATVCSYVEMRRLRTMTVCSFQVKDFTGQMKMVWFNSPYIKKTFYTGKTYIFVGVVTVRNHERVMVHPEYYAESKYLEKRKELQPIYPLTSGLTNNRVQKDMKAVSSVLHKIPEYLPEDLAAHFSMMEYKDALRQIHFPENESELLRARERLVFDEFFLFLISMRQLQAHCLETENLFDISEDTLAREMEEKLPFSLTEAQKKVLGEIREDLMGPHVMNRLVQGDVGSGKTIVAILALAMVAESGYQGALMAPTEVLAAQHYEKISAMFEPYGYRVALLTGSTSAAEKKEIYAGLKDGSISVVVGTHALIQAKVEYRELALAVIDEQHRFGVRQRQMLSDKGSEPHVLIMSATPIPRTLAIILYGDLQLSVMDEMPKNRLPIKNCVVPPSYRPTAYKFIADQVGEGHQAYVICPMVEDAEGMDAENVISYAGDLQTQLPAYIQVAYLHGKMSAKEKAEIMERFYQGEIHVLVSTTVVEVGIDNPNATVIMIENAERFGLSQLHQLRGRVGRGEAQSYCIMINTSDTEEAKERLEVINHSNDGFHIANEDLRLRGPGDFFGARQSGDVLFSLADLYSDAEVLKRAQNAVHYLETVGFDFESMDHVKLQKKVDMALQL